MKLACRKMCVSKTTFGSPGCSDLITSSTPLVTSRALPHGSFSTTSSRPGPSSTMASPANIWWSSLTVATDPMGTWTPSALSTVTCARSAGVTIGNTCRIPSRWLAESIEPPVSMIEPQQAAIHRVCGRLHHTVQADLLGGHLVRLDLHGHHLQPLTPDGDVGHSG